MTPPTYSTKKLLFTNDQNRKMQLYRISKVHLLDIQTQQAILFDYK
jgi:hypothetical protein